MLYVGYGSDKLLSKVLQIKIHQTCVIILVFICKEAEFIAFVESCCSSERIHCNKTAPRAISVNEHVLHTIKYESAYSLTSIGFVHSQTPDLNGRVMIPLFTEWNLTIDAIAYTLLCLVKSNDIVQQTIIGYYITILRIHKEVGDGKVFCLIIFRFIQQKFVQVAFGTFERCKICLGCQYPNRYIGKVHLNKGQSGELRLNISYACRALSFSSEETGDG